ncbi:MAG: hypothetical protein HC837_20365 [Chloroflexaceae bacterium]|nr:hypothetical protein [Chloroflexaceae bacterium]
MNTVTIDQQANAGQWVSLGRYFFGARFDPTVEITDQTDEDNRTIRVDALAWLPEQDTTPPVVSIQGITRLENGYRIAWSGEDDQSGIARYDLEVRRLPSPTWRPWLSATTRTEAVIAAADSDILAFRIRARDRSGNESVWSAMVDTSIAIAENPPAVVDPAQPPAAVAANDQWTDGVITNGGNLRLEPYLVAETVIAQVCPGDRVTVLERQVLDNHTWLRVRVNRTVADCVADHVATATEGWLSHTLVGQP